MRKTLFPVLFSLLVFSCKAQPALVLTSLQLDPQHTLLLLDSAQASQVLLHDATDRFFERVTAAEMSIQMKQALQPGQTRADLLPAFTGFLQRDVENFSAAESMLAAEVMQEIFNTCLKVAPDLFPDTLILIKTKGKHYGPSVYYTRENTVIIPADALEPSIRRAFTGTMYHELFHVFSRLNPEKRAQLYRLIGFEHIGLENLVLPEKLADRVLYNPDGVDFAQRIRLQLENGSAIDAIPVIYAKHPGYQPDVRSFFGYVEFNLYQIEAADSSAWRVITADDGYSSTLHLNEIPDFFRQIKDNTGYIIHPDEVLADNFAFLMRAQNKPSANDRFSEEGKKLIADMEAVLKGEK